VENQDQAEPVPPLRIDLGQWLGAFSLSEDEFLIGEKWQPATLFRRQRLLTSVAPGAFFDANQ
jgi:hypothetical protein